MKKIVRWLLLAVVLGAMGLLPFRGTDAAKLVPVRTVLVTRSGDQYEVDVGRAVRGIGRTLSEALAKLREQATGELFFPTAEQVIVVDPAGTDGETVRAVTEAPEFRPGAGLYRTTEPDLDAEAVGAYLSSHPCNTTIMEIRGALRSGDEPELPVLREADGGYRVDAP